MSYIDKTKEELISELINIQQSYDLLREKYDKEIFLLKQNKNEGSLNEEIFRKAYYTSPDSININRLSDGMYVSVNESFTRITGYTKDDVTGKTSFELNIWVDSDERKALVNELESKGTVRNLEARFLTKNGTVIIGLIAASLIDLEGVPHILSIIRDITTSKIAEKALEKEKFLVNALMNNITDRLYFKDLDSKFIRINKSLSEVFGIDDPVQAIGKTDFDFFTREHAQQAYDDEQTIIKTGQLLSKVEKETIPNSPDSWVSTVKLPLHDKNGNIIGTFGISRDITSQKKSEDQLLLIANALKSINECVSITDVNDKVLFLNKAFLDTYGYNENDLKEESISLIRSPNNAPEVVQEILPATLRGGWHGELINRKKDGSEFLIYLSTAIVKNNEEKPIALIGVANDITLQKKIEMERQVIYEVIQGITVTSNLDELLKLIHHSLGKVVYAENCFVALYDNEKELFNFPYFIDKVDTAPQPNSLEKSCTAYVFRTLKPFLFNQKDYDRLVEQKEVELIGSASLSWIGIPLQTPSKVIGVLVLQHYEKENVYSENDLNFLSSIGSQIAVAIERKKTEEEIIMKNDLLLSINAEKDKLFSIIAHDLRGPMSAFVAATQILTEDVQNMTIEDIRDISMNMKNDASNAYLLLENLLEWSRLQRGIMEFNPQKLRLDNIIGTSIGAVLGSAKTKGIEININIPDELYVTADKHMVETVFRNLLANAVKFTYGGGKINVSALSTTDNFVEIRIIDTGIGMTPELKGKLFKINENTNRPGTAGEPSSGLGLLLCKEFIEKHHGKIWVESEVGTGSTFYFLIPGERNQTLV
jgi:PAS domain S-box-containing protein